MITPDQNKQHAASAGFIAAKDQMDAGLERIIAASMKVARAHAKGDENEITHLSERVIRLIESKTPRQIERMFITVIGVVAATAVRNSPKPHDLAQSPEECAGCKGRIILQELTAKDNLPLCNRHWSRWIARFLNSDDAPGCHAHLILETHDSETHWANGQLRLLTPEAYERLSANRRKPHGSESGDNS